MTMWEKSVDSLRTSIRVDGNRTFRVEGVVHLRVELDGHKRLAFFSVVLKLPAKMILGTAFINKEIVKIEMNNSQVVMGGSHVVAIIESFDDEEAVQLMIGTGKRDDGTFIQRLPTCIKAKAEAIFLPRSEVPVMACTV